MVSFFLARSIHRRRADEHGAADVRPIGEVHAEVFRIGVPAVLTHREQRRRPHRSSIPTTWPLTPSLITTSRPSGVRPTDF